MVFKYVIANTETSKCKVYNITATCLDEANNKLFKFLVPFIDSNEEDKFEIADLETLLEDFNYNLFYISKEIDVD